MCISKPIAFQGSRKLWLFEFGRIIFLLLATVCIRNKKSPPPPAERAWCLSTRNRIRVGGQLLSPFPPTPPPLGLSSCLLRHLQASIPFGQFHSAEPSTLAQYLFHMMWSQLLLRPTGRILPFMCLEFHTSSLWRSDLGVHGDYHG